MPSFVALYASSLLCNLSLRKIYHTYQKGVNKMIHFVAGMLTENKCSTNMRSNNWLRQLREKAGIETQDDLAARLQLEGFNVGRGAIGHWETGRNTPPLDDPELRTILAKVLRVSEPELLRQAGYPVIRTHRSELAEQAADIVDELSPDKQDLAVRLLEQLRAS